MIQGVSTYVHRNMGQVWLRRGLLSRVSWASAVVGLTAALDLPLAKSAAAQLQTGPIDPPQPLRSLFEFHVRQGPSAGLDLSGLIMLQADATGALKGVWTLADQTTVTIVGQATGRAINLLLTLPDGRVVFGVGTADRAWGDRVSIIGGVGTGPEPGDMADWLVGTPSNPGGGD